MTPLYRLAATRYVTPLREGGSLPAILDTVPQPGTDEAAGGLFVAKFRGAGQGARVLVAELLVGQIAAHLGLPMPDLALIDLDAAFGRSEPDQEIQDLLQKSRGLNVGLRYLDGAFGYDPVAMAPLIDPDLAAEIVWMDALCLNVDRTPRNPNLLVHGRKLWLIDHGAALYLHHDWASVTAARARAQFPMIEQHVLLPVASSIVEADLRLAPRLTREALRPMLDRVPDALLLDAPPGHPQPFATADDARDAYLRLFAARLGWGDYGVPGPDDARPFVSTAEAARLNLPDADDRPLAYRR
jgi:hypothetical protein